MNFSVVADDHLLGVTHVIRGKDHIANTRRQRYIYDHFGWKVPVYRHYGRMGIEGVVLSTSQMRLGINEGTYSGWDDIRLGTLRALARRGISPEAVKNAMIAIGIGDVDISFSWDNLYAENRKIVDPVANRYFFVPDPVAIKINGAPDHTAHAMLHPSDPARGSRTLMFEGDRAAAAKRDRARDRHDPAQGSLQCQHLVGRGCPRHFPTAAMRLRMHGRQRRTSSSGCRCRMPSLHPPHAGRRDMRCLRTRGNRRTREGCPVREGRVCPDRFCGQLQALLRILPTNNSFYFLYDVLRNAYRGMEE